MINKQIKKKDHAKSTSKTRQEALLLKKTI
jgi:hypothetical protein